MRIRFNKQLCQNIRKSLRKEWLETNGLGDYASSTIIGCNTRKYHGLLVADLARPVGRHVLLSTLEESVLVEGQERFFSCRRHPALFFPRGHEYLQSVSVGPWTSFEYRFGDVLLSREILMTQGKRLTIIRYVLRPFDGAALPETPVLRIKPLLAFRNAHDLTHANPALQVKTWPVSSGFGIRPYNELPPLYMQVAGAHSFVPSPDWCRNVQYPVEAERGFPHEEELFQPGILDIVLETGKAVYLSASTAEVESPEEYLPALWSAEVARRIALNAKMDMASPGASHAGRLEEHLAREARRFTVRDAGKQPSVVAGYHWFGAWGRDTCISVPGLTFWAGRAQEGVSVLLRMGKSIRNGLVPNLFSADGNHAYNSVDASLWYVWAIQQMILAVPDTELLVRQQCWPVIKQIVRAYSEGAVQHVRLDDEGFLRVGDASTQLTWMDAAVGGKPVTPRHGCPVEIAALWYNALAFARELGRMYGEMEWDCMARLNRMRAVFRERFRVDRPGGSYFADVWRPEGQDRACRPNQLFAVSLPHSICENGDGAAVVETVRNTLLTPFGLRTLSPEDDKYCRTYRGDAARRDSAYHQGTVWPWLLGSYTEALLKTSWDTDSASATLLETVTPLFAEHFFDAGIGSISEIFDADPPYHPDGCIAQAWSVAEVLRMLRLIRCTAPSVYAAWEAALMRQFPSKS